MSPRLKTLIAHAIRVLIIATALALLFDGATRAAEMAAERFVTHNGSLMVVNVRPNGRVEIRYRDPRPGIAAIGVRPGNLLVHGHWNGPTFKGIAHVFAGPCGAIPYMVSGGVDQNNVLTLQGAAPIVDMLSCTYVLGWTHNSTLVFEEYPC